MYDSTSEEEVLYSYLNKPAVLSCLTGDYLTQFFRTPVTASILMGGGLCLYWD